MDDKIRKRIIRYSIIVAASAILGILLMLVFVSIFARPLTRYFV